MRKKWWYRYNSMKLRGTFETANRCHSRGSLPYPWTFATAERLAAFHDRLKLWKIVSSDSNSRFR